MPYLFYTPKVTSLPGSLLYFSSTLTESPQNTYQDIDLTIPHQNPVEADAAGVFPPIYLSPTLPSYKVVHRTAAGVQIYSINDVPSNQNVQQSTRLESTNPNLFFYDTDGTSGSRKYRVRAAGAAFEVQASNEAETVFTTILRYESGVLYSNSTEVAVTTSSTFTGTLTGCTTSPTATFSYRKVNNIVTLWTDANLTGTSDNIAMTLTGVPAAIRPTTAKIIPCSSLTDNSIAVEGACSVGTGGAITFAVSTVSGTKIIPGVFVTSGTKGISTGWCITYSLS